MSREFLTKVEATYARGLACASQLPKLRRQGTVRVDDVRVALRTADGTVYEAEKGERLHSQMYLRLARLGVDLDRVEAGFTVEAPEPAQFAEATCCTCRSASDIDPNCPVGAHAALAAQDARELRERRRRRTRR